MVSEKKPEYRWYQKGIVDRLIEREKSELSEILPRLYGYHLVYLGDPEFATLIQASLIAHRVYVSPHCQEKGVLSALQGSLESLPLASDSVDVMVLSHVLEHVANPHEVLREAHRVLIPEGHLVITGLNPISLWGLWHAFGHLSGDIISNGKLLSMNRVRDWLKLLNFQMVGGKMFYFRPPIQHEGLDKRLLFLEKWGQYLWPFGGGAYTLLAVKRIIPLTPIRIRWPGKSLWQTQTSGLPKPTTTIMKKEIPFARK